MPVCVCPSVRPSVIRVVCKSRAGCCPRGKTWHSLPRATRLVILAPAPHHTDTSLRMIGMALTEGMILIDCCGNDPQSIPSSSVTYRGTKPAHVRAVAHSKLVNNKEPPSRLLSK